MCMSESDAASLLWDLLSRAELSSPDENGKYIAAVAMAVSRLFATGDLIMCKECKYCGSNISAEALPDAAADLRRVSYCSFHDQGGWGFNSYCSFAEKFDQNVSAVQNESANVKESEDDR